jgi:WD40 repeat protein
MSQPSCYYCQTSVQLHAPTCPTCQQMLMLRGRGALTFSPDGALLCAGYDNGAVTIWRTSNQQAYYLAPEHNNMVTSLHFLPHQQTMISCDAQSKIVLWEPEI